MADIVIMVPTEREAEFFALRGFRAHICGVGMAECATSTAHLLADGLIEGRRLDLVVLAGIAGVYADHSCAGACAGGLGLGDTVVVASETIADLGRREGDSAFVPLFQKNYSAGFVPSGFPAVHSNTVNCAGGLISHSGEATIENMEGAAFFAVCERFGVQAMEVRTISNRVGEPVTAEGLDLAARRLAADLEKLLSLLLCR